MALPATPGSGSALLKQWREYCKMHSEMHDASRGHFKALNHGLMIPTIVLSSVTGIGTIGVGTNDKNCEQTTNWVLISLGALGLISTCLLSVHRLLGCADLQREHDLYSDLYESLSHEIDMQLVLNDSGDSRMFVNTREFIKYCKSKMDVLIDKAPPIPKKIMKANDVPEPPTMSQICITVGPRRTISSPDMRS